MVNCKHTQDNGEEMQVPVCLLCSNDKHHNEDGRKLFGRSHFMTLDMEDPTIGITNMQQITDATLTRENTNNSFNFSKGEKEE
jgi:hypothetical protein